MSECFHLSDRMPGVARGTMRWSEADARHLASCPDCAAEWGLVQAGARLGRSVEGEFDSAGVAARVAAGLRADSRPAGRLRRLAPWFLPLAAAAVVALAVGLGNRPAGRPAATPVEWHVLPELESLSATELESMLTLLPADGSGPREVRSLEDLSEAELAAVLTELEG